MKALTNLLDVSLIVSTGENFATKKTLTFLFRGNLKQLQSYLFNLSRIYSFRVECVKSVVDLDTGKTILRHGGIK